MDDVPEVLYSDAIRLPKGFGPRAGRALGEELFVRNASGNLVEFDVLGTGLSGCVLQAVRDLGPSGEGRRIEVIFHTGPFGFKPMLGELNSWAGATYGVDTFLQRIEEEQGHFVIKNGPQVTVELLMRESWETVTIPVYPAALRNQVQKSLGSGRPNARRRWQVRKRYSMHT